MADDLLVFTMMYALQHFSHALGTFLARLERLGFARRQFALARRRPALASCSSSHARFLIGLLCASTFGWAQAPDRTFRDCADCPVMVALASGTFIMGDVENPSALPVHRVELKHPFALGQTEVTEAQFRLFLLRTGYNAGRSHLTSTYSPLQPAIDLDWYAATAYSRWLSRLTAKRYRLPTEAEWDYAAHAGTLTRYWWGDLAADGCGKEALQSTFFPPDQPCASQRGVTVANVAGQRANPWGIFDMLGNAGEWTQDCWNDSYQGVPSDGTTFIGGRQRDLRVIRGPDFLNSATWRHPVDPSYHSSEVGFRLARDLP